MREITIIIAIMISIIICGVCGISAYQATRENSRTLTKTITIIEKLCPVSPTSGKIEDENETQYFVPLKDCGDYTIGSQKTIQYNHIHQIAIGKQYEFDRVVGDYRE